jgi:hypothetical protein
MSAPTVPFSEYAPTVATIKPDFRQVAAGQDREETRGHATSKRGPQLRAIVKGDDPCRFGQQRGVRFPR